MNPNDAAQLALRDIHLPGLIAWWPPAPGWWLVAALALAGLVAFASLRAVGGVTERPDSDEVAGLIGQRWLRYLDSRWQRDEFTGGAGRLLLAAPYARPDTIERQHAIELAALCADWLRSQRPRRRAAYRGERAAARRFGRASAAGGA